MRVAALEYALVVVDRAGERALAVAEELRLDQRLRELRQVDRDEALGEVGREPALLHDVRDELRAPDRGRGGPLSGPGFAEEKCREILHAIPERGLVAAHVVRDDVVPQRLAQAPHRFAFAGERALDEMERAPQLEKEREKTHRALLRKAAAHQIRDRVVAERHRERRAALSRLALDQRVELRHTAVVAHI